MKTENIYIENLKCSGCMRTIIGSLSKIDGVKEVKIDQEHELVSIDSDDATDRSVLVSKLFDLGYPEMGHNSFGRKAKSFVSCAIGRM
jgi:copper chaperone CopZ